jgi:hypothetical protein
MGMIQREFTYQVPFQRLNKLARSAARKAYGTVLLLTQLWIVIYLLAIILLAVYGDAFLPQITIRGFPAGILLAFLGVGAIFLLGIRLLRRLRTRQLKERANFDSAVHFTQEDGGLRIATPAIEYYVKWQGISQLLLEPDGIAVSHGNLFWFVPNSVFLNPEDRLAFIREVYERLGERAKAVSERHLRPVLAAHFEASGK